MSTSFARSLAKHLDKIIVGPPIFDARGRVKNMVVYPLLPSSLHPDPPDMITLSEAMRRGVELSDSGIVSRVHVDNPLPTSILAGESELLIGSSQLRSVQFSCLIPPDRRVALPVSCAEEKQPIKYQAKFTHSDACPWPVRSFKNEQMAAYGDPPQHWLWENIKDYLRSSDTPSNTSDIHAVFDKNSSALQGLSALFPFQPGQVGAICAVGQNLFLELFGDPEILEDRYDNLLRSALVEALAHPDDQSIPPNMVPTFLRQITAASQKSRLMKSRGLKEGGRSLAFADRNISGSALVADGRLVHLTAHQKCLGLSQSFGDLQPELKTAHTAWESEHSAFIHNLEQDYADRRRRYRKFKEKLKPISDSFLPAEEDQDGDLPLQTPPDQAVRPLPLNPFLHDFFLRLFKRD